MVCSPELQSIHCILEGTFLLISTSLKLSKLSLLYQLIGIWMMCTWQQMGCPPNLRIVELGPGRGTLMADLLRGTRVAQAFTSSIESVHLVEVSQSLRKIQQRTLGCEEQLDLVVDGSSSTSQISGAKIQWHRSLAHIPVGGHEIILAHEFLDALPVHQFVKTESGWCERLVDVADAEDPHHFRFVCSPKATPAFALLGRRRLSWIQGDEASRLSQIEVGGQMLAAVVEIAQRIAATQGAALLIDYGKDGVYESSVQGIQNHEFVDILNDPGFADLSVHIDFSAVRKAVEESRSECVMHGPVEQGQFLHTMGIAARLEALCQNASQEQKEVLEQGYARLVQSTEENAEGMGEIYKVVAICPKNADAPVAFEV